MDIIKNEDGTYTITETADSPETVETTTTLAGLYAERAALTSNMEEYTTKLAKVNASITAIEEMEVSVDAESEEAEPS